MRNSPDSYREIYRVAVLIPKGQVATYGQVAALAGLPGRARLVGYALSANRDRSLPWQRVVNAKGEISHRAGEDAPDPVQRLRLESEGVIFDARGRISLSRYRWNQGPEQSAFF